MEISKKEINSKPSTQSINNVALENQKSRISIGFEEVNIYLIPFLGRNSIWNLDDRKLINDVYVRKSRILIRRIELRICNYLLDLN